MVLARFAAILSALLIASGAASAQGAKPTDPQIAHIAYTAGLIDIAAADQALQKSKNKDVVAFANDMKRDHQAVNDQATDKRAELAKLSGAAFDKAYIDNEVAYHKAVDDALETALIPSASNQELKS